MNFAHTFITQHLSIMYLLGLKNTRVSANALQKVW